MWIQTGKEEVKVSLFSDDISQYLKDLKGLERAHQLRAIAAFQADLDLSPTSHKVACDCP